MRILLLGSHMNYNLEYYLYMNFQRLGHDVEFYGYGERLGWLASPARLVITRSKLARNIADLIWLNGVNEEIERLAEKFRPDLVLSIKGEAVRPKTVKWLGEKLGTKTALWYPDDPRFFGSLVKHIAPHYDHVFTASERAVAMYADLGVRRTHYLPFACEPMIHRRIEPGGASTKKRAGHVVFVGTYYPRRARMIEALERAGIEVRVYGPYWRYFKRGVNIWSGVYGPEMVAAFNAAGVVLNIHAEEDLGYKVNMRTFESTGSGAFLLTDIPYGLEKVYDVGREVVGCRDDGEFVELAKYYLDSDVERSDIASRGQSRAYREHTYAARSGAILQAIGSKFERQ